MAIRMFCDLCGKQMKPFERKRKLKIKEGRKFMNSLNSWVTEWETIDAHDECVRILLEAKREAGGWKQE